MMQDVTDSFTRAVAVTPSDTVPISFGAAPPNPPYARRLFVGTAGTVTLIVVFDVLPLAYSLWPISVTVIAYP